MYPPLAEVYKKLEKIVGDKTYSEAFRIDLNDLPDFIEILFWAGRCDPSFPEYVFLFDNEEKLKLNLCKYGNIHSTEFHEERLTHEVLSKLGWTVIEGQEFDNFSQDGKIEGRRVKI